MTRPRKTESNHFAQAVKMRREFLGLNQTEAYTKAGLSRSAWHQIETGKTKEPQTETVTGLSAALEADVELVWQIVRGEVVPRDGAAWDSVVSGWRARVKPIVDAVEDDRARVTELAATMSAEQVRRLREAADSLLAS